MYRIIAYNPDGSQLTIYDPVGAGALPVLAPKSAEEINEAGTVEFALIYGHPAYGLLMPKKTYISAELDGKEFFYGRVINADPSPLTGQIQYQCAGALSFLQDSEVPPDPKKSDGTTDFQTMTAEAFLSRCIDAHNADVGDDERRIFTVGTVNHSRKSETRQFQISNYQDTRNVIDQNILNYYGGFLRVRRVEESQEYQNSKRIQKQYFQLGNTELLKRPKVPVGTMIAAGWDDPGEGYATVYSISYSAGTDGIPYRQDLILHVTPIRKNGTVLSPAQLDQYVDNLLSKTSVESILSEDKNDSSLLLWVQTGITNWQEAYERSELYDDLLHRLQAVYYLNDLESMPDQEELREFNDSIMILPVTKALYIDWLEDDYGDTDEGVLELGRNIISILHRMNGEDLFTSIRPVGENGITLSGSQTMDLYPNAEMAEYGKIVRSVNFPNAKNESDLQTEASAFIEKIQKTLLISSDISLLDMKFADEDQHGVCLGDKFTHIVGFEGTPLIVTARNRDFERPQNDSCTLKNKKAYDGTDSTEPSSTGGSISKRSSRNSSAGGAAFKYIHEYQDRLELNAKAISIAGEQIEIHADQLVETANEFARISHREGAVDTRLNIIEGTGVFQNSEHITSLAGRFHYDPITKAVELLDGSEFKIHQQDGAMITVGTRLTELGQDTSTFKGSALWTQRDNITGVCGEFDVMTIDGKRTLVIKSGGGIKIRRNNTEFGLYDEGNLTGGIMVNKLNDGSVVTKIRGDKIDLTTNDGYTQLVADKNGLQTTVAAQQTTINQHGVTISSMTGSALWTQRNAITGVVGEFDVIDVNGVKTLVVKSGGGIKIRRNNTEFGLYDDGNLTAGVICNRINGGTTTINASRILLDGNTTVSGMLGIEDGALRVKGSAFINGNLTMATGTDIIAGSIRATDIRFPGSNPGEDTHLTRAAVAAMLVKAEVNGNVLTITDHSGNAVIFSKATTLSGAWSGQIYTVTASPQNSKISVTISSVVAMQQGECYAYATWTSASSTTPSSIYGTSKKLTIVNSTDNTVKLQSAGSDVGLTFTHNKYATGYNAGNTAGYNSAHVTGSWNGKIFTYSKTTAGSSNSASITVNSVVAMQQGKCYAYATWTSSSSTTPSSISGTSKELTIVNSTDNTVKLQAAGSDVGLTFTHNKYTTGYNAGYAAGYAVTDISGGWTGYSNNTKRYTLVSGSGASANCSMQVEVTTHGYSEVMTWSAPVTNAYRDGYAAGGGGVTPSYSIANIAAGNDWPSSSSPSQFLPGYSAHRASPGARQNQNYQYIRFTVDGRKHVFYF